MCSWCWGFRNCWFQLKLLLADKLEIRYILGGLAADTEETMPGALQERIKSTWRQIENSIPGTRFNFDFWTQCTPRRSTYAACRAVIAARKQHADMELAMIDALQKSYYMQAQNPSEKSQLMSCARTLGLDEKQFSTDLDSHAVNEQLHKEIQFAEHLGAQGYPSLVLQTQQDHFLIEIDYNNPVPVYERIISILQESC